MEGLIPRTEMHLKILLPFKLFSENTGVLRIVAGTPTGSFGLLPQRLDCVAALYLAFFFMKLRKKVRLE
jgi:F-type H+-transporting ATPase subunit epsilon